LRYTVSSFCLLAYDHSALSATGIAGPSGGTPQTPVGTVFIGCAGPQGTRVDECHFEGERQQVRRQAAQHALRMALAAAGEEDTE